MPLSYSSTRQTSFGKMSEYIPNESAAWLEILNRIRNDKWSKLGICTEITKLHYERQISYDIAHSMRQRLQKYKPSETLLYGYFWKAGLVAPRLEVLHTLIYDAMDEDSRKALDGIIQSQKESQMGIAPKRIPQHGDKVLLTKLVSKTNKVNDFSIFAIVVGALALTTHELTDGGFSHAFRVEILIPYLDSDYSTQKRTILAVIDESPSGIGVDNPSGWRLVELV